MIWIITYFAIGLATFIVLTVWEDTPVECPQYYYTFGAVVVVLFWPVLLWEEMR